MGSPYVEPTLTGYNASPPSDDGSQTEANKVKWATIKEKLDDPIKAYAQAISSAMLAASGDRFGNTKNAQSTNYGIQTTDRGAWIAASNTITVTLPSAVTVGDGWIVGVVNVSATTISIATTSSQTINGSGTTASLTARGDGMMFMSDGANWVAVIGLASNDSLPKGYISGLVISNNSSDAGHDIDISVGECRDSSDAANLAITSVLTKQIDVNWVAGTNAGGFPSSLSLSANTVYHFFMIRNSSTSVVDAGFDTSLTAANLLTASSYDQYRRIGSVITNGSNTIIAFKTIESAGGGLDFLWTDPPLDVDVTNPGTSAVTRTLSVPTGINVVAKMNVICRSAVAANSSVYLSSLDVNDEASSVTAAPLATVTHNASAATDVGAQARVRTNTSAQIRSRQSGSTANTGFKIATLGWEDHRR
ncbi:MAG: hypothetical protein KGZ69_15980 [Methylomonas sp.]|nr:hypothetical protein [Methylomonas sp.]